MEVIKGFSKMSRDQKVEWLASRISDNKLPEFLESFRLADKRLQESFENFSENTLSNFHLPWGIIPNMIIDGELFHVPVVIEESSVVAAASKAASFWAERGGFRSLFVSTIKRGQIHFLYHGNQQQLKSAWPQISSHLRESVSSLTENMMQRGGGIITLDMKKVAGLPDNYNQIIMEARTMESMGANFINSVLEEMARALPALVSKYAGKGEVDVIMAILSNHTPDCIVRMHASAPVEQMQWTSEMSAQKFAERMKLASDIAWHDKSRATTHNKGIFNGVDGVVIATGNDFRAVEAAGHAFAMKAGKYKSLSRISIDNNQLVFEMELPLALGTVGGLTKLHPLAAKSLEILGNPSVKILMKIAAATGMANNFAAMASLVTTGIQKGHMKMHLHNILASLDADPVLYENIREHFAGKTVSMSAVKKYLSSLQHKSYG
jgi:hydroxymethylglutaryl-CoA reductase